MQIKSLTGFGYAKALIFGEYAVLHGAPGLVAALSPRLYLQMTKFQLNEAREKTATLERLDDFGCQLRAFLHYFLNADAEISLDMSEFFDKFGQKIGIGSSAAAVVALLDAYAQATGKSFDLNMAIRMHRALQGGIGSGIDIIASAKGGVSLVRNCPETPVITQIPENCLPKMAILASHIEAPTRRFVSAAMHVMHQRDYQNVIAEMTELYEHLSALIIEGKKSDFLEQIALLPALLKKLACIIDMPILPAVYEKLAPIAREHQVVLKTSGAGGGDIFMALGLSTESIDNFMTQIPQSLGVTRLDVKIASER